MLKLLYTPRMIEVLMDYICYHQWGVDEGKVICYHPRGGDRGCGWRVEGRLMGLEVVTFFEAKL